MKNGIVGVVLCLVVAIGLVACGGGGGGGSCTGCADTMSVSEEGAAAVTYTEGPYNVLGYLDPILSSYVTTSANTYISLCSGITLSSTPSGSITTCANQVIISITGNTPQSYPTGTVSSPTQITYKTNNILYSSVFSSTTGTITLSSVGNVGEKITGSFDAVVTNIHNLSDTLWITGTFSVKRDYY